MENENIRIEHTDKDRVHHIYQGYHHCENAPAIIHPNGNETWYYNGLIHREGDLPAMTQHNGKSQYWIKHGQYHRQGAPAIILENGLEEWYTNGKLHREDGPAIVDSVRGNQYWINGVKQEQVG